MFKYNIPTVQQDFFFNFVWISTLENISLIQKILMRVQKCFRPILSQLSVSFNLWQRCNQAPCHWWCILILFSYNLFNKLIQNILLLVQKYIAPIFFQLSSQLQLVTKMQSRPLSLVVYFDLCFPMISMTSHRQSSIKRQTLWQFQYSKIFIIFASHSQSGSYTV